MQANPSNFVTARRSVKDCARCGEAKPFDQFYRRSDGRPSSYCRPCTRAASQANYRQRRQDPTTLARMRAVDRRRKRRLRAQQHAKGGDAA